HDRGTAAASRRDREGDGADHERDHRHYARTDVGLRADGVFSRLDRRHLPAVLADARHVDRVLGAARVDVDAGALRDAVATCPPRIGYGTDRAVAPATARALLRGVQQRLQTHDRSLSDVGRLAPDASVALSR